MSISPTVLSLDPGAERAGWAVLEPGPIYIDSGVISTPRRKSPKEQYQPYRLRLMEKWLYLSFDLFKQHNPDLIVSEIVPPVGAGSSGGIQLQLALSQITVVHIAAFIEQIPVIQIGATRVQTKIGWQGKTKPRVRNGVIKILPELVVKRKDWRHVFEEPDAIAIGLTQLGYTNS